MKEFDRAELRKRLEILFMAETDSRSPRGFINWTAERLLTHRTTVSRWLDSGPSGAVPLRQTMRQIEQLEELVELRKPGSIKAARARLRRLRKRM